MGGDRIKCRIVCIRTVLCKPFQGCVDDVRVFRFACLIAESQSVNRARSHVLYKNIAFLKQILHQLQTLRGLGVAGDGLLVHIHNKETIAVNARLCLGISALLAGHRPLHLNDFCSEPCKNLGADGACLKLCHVQDPVSA